MGGVVCALRAPLSGARRDRRAGRRLRGSRHDAACEPVAAGGILLVGIASLALVRPWGLRLPRRVVIAAALAGSAYAAAHALTAYVTKPLHAAGVIQLQFRGWATRHEAAQLAWDLLFYEPWFLGLGVFVTLGALHHHRRTGGSARAAVRLAWTTVAGTLSLTAIACAIVVARDT